MPDPTRIDGAALRPYRTLKWEIEQPNSDGRSYVAMPETWVPMSVGVQGDAMVVWATGPTPGGTVRMRTLIVVNTGVTIPMRGDERLLGTLTSAGIVWHVFDGGFGG